MKSLVAVEMFPLFMFPIFALGASALVYLVSLCIDLVRLHFFEKPLFKKIGANLDRLTERTRQLINYTD